MRDMFDDAFTPVARDGAGTVEVSVRLQKAFESLASIGLNSLRVVATAMPAIALARAENALVAPEDLEVLRKAANSLIQPDSLQIEYCDILLLSQLNTPTMQRQQYSSL